MTPWSCNSLYPRPALSSRPRRHGVTARRLLWLGLLTVLPVRAAGDPAALEGKPEILHFAFSNSMFSDVNVNDAKAAIKVWTEAMARDLQANIGIDTQILDELPAVRTGLLAGQIDAAAATVREFLTLETEMPFDPIFIATQEGSDYEQYVLLVHRESGLQEVEDLRGRDVALWQNPRTCLADAWLQSLFAGRTNAEHDAFHRSIIRSEKLSAVILPVFFRKTDACVVTRRGWEMLGELNPQVTQQLRELAASPELVTMVLFFRAGYQSPSKGIVMQALLDMPKSPNGRQILTLFRGEALQEAPRSVLDSASSLYRQMRASGSQSNPVTSTKISARGLDRVSEER